MKGRFVNVKKSATPLFLVALLGTAFSVYAMIEISETGKAGRGPTPTPSDSYEQKSSPSIPIQYESAFLYYQRIIEVMQRQPGNQPVPVHPQIKQVQAAAVKARKEAVLENIATKGVLTGQLKKVSIERVASPDDSSSSSSPDAECMFEFDDIK